MSTRTPTTVLTSVLCHYSSHRLRVHQPPQATLLPFCNHIFRRLNGRFGSLRSQSDITELNELASTRPTEIHLPSRLPTEATLKYTYRCGKVYFSFYKIGIRNVFENMRSARQIHKRLRAEHKCDMIKAIDSGALSRSEFLILQRNHKDVRKIPIILLVILTTREFSLVILSFLGALVPGTCKTPTQILKMRQATEKRRDEFERSFMGTDIKTNLKAIKSILTSSGNTSALSRPQLKVVAASLGLYSRKWERFDPVNLPPTAWLRRRVKNSVEYLNLDDMLLKRNEVISIMVIEEVRIALVERGMRVSERTDEELRRSLQSWVDFRDSRSIPDILTERFVKAAWTKA